MGVEEWSREGVRVEEKVVVGSFFFFGPKKKKNFYRSICLVVLAASVVSECIDGGEQKFRGCVLYCFGWASELKCIKSCCHHAAVTIFRQKCRAGLHVLWFLLGVDGVEILREIATPATPLVDGERTCYCCCITLLQGCSVVIKLHASILLVHCSPFTSSIVTSFLLEMIYLRCNIVSHISIFLSQNVNIETILKGYTVNI